MGRGSWLRGIGPVGKTGKEKDGGRGSLCVEDPDEVTVSWC